MKNYPVFKRKMLADKEIRSAYEKLGPEFRLVQAIIEKRLRKSLTQAELARKIGTRQSAISRLESGRANPSLAFLGKVARALDVGLEISLK